MFTAGSPEAARLLSQGKTARGSDSPVSFLQQETCVLHIILGVKRALPWQRLVSTCYSLISEHGWKASSANMTLWRTQSSPIAPILEAVMSCAVRSSQKHRRFYHCGCWLFRRISCVAWTGHKSNFFSCSYVKKNYGYGLRLPRKCHVTKPDTRSRQTT